MLLLIHHSLIKRHISNFIRGDTIMRRLLFAGILAILVLAALVTSQVFPGAKSDVAYAAAATITMDSGCLLFNGNDVLVVASSDHAVVTNVTNNNQTILKCSVKGTTPPPSGKAAILKEFGCNTPGGFTTNTRSVVSASGNSTLTCKLP